MPLLYLLGLLMGSDSMTNDPAADQMWWLIHQLRMWLPFTSSTHSRSAMAT